MTDPIREAALALCEAFASDPGMYANASKETWTAARALRAALAAPEPRCPERVTLESGFRAPFAAHHTAADAERDRLAEPSKTPRALRAALAAPEPLTDPIREAAAALCEAVLRSARAHDVPGREWSPLEGCRCLSCLATALRAALASDEGCPCCDHGAPDDACTCVVVVPPLASEPEFAPDRETISGGEVDADGDCPECYAGIQSGDGHNEGCSQRGDFGGFATPEAQQDAMCPDNAEETRQLIEVERDLHVARSERDEARYELAEARAGLADANAHIANAAEAYSAAIRERNIAQNAEAVANAARAYVAARCSHGEGAMARDSDAWDALRAAVEGQ